ncbi:MAG: hypothetical protein ACJAXM_000584 [Arenicella sp.]|jgi:hypothetical protein
MTNEILVETSGDSMGRRDNFKELKGQLSQHAVAEARHFYVPLTESDKQLRV